MFGVASVRKIQPRDIHPRFQQPLQNPRIARCRTNRANDFGMSKAHAIRTASILPSPRAAAHRIFPYAFNEKQ
jgi:hypothetical protein